MNPGLSFGVGVVAGLGVGAIFHNAWDLLRKLQPGRHKMTEHPQPPPEHDEGQDFDGEVTPDSDEPVDDGEGDDR